jgi:membrane-associated phospholipid phosphatase
VPLPLPSGQRSHDDTDQTPGHDTIDWSPKRDVFYTSTDLAVTGVSAAVIIGAAIARPRPQHWRGGLLFDEEVRDALRVQNIYGRYATRDASDVGVSLMSTWPFLVDALITAWWYRGRADLARNMAVVSAEAFALAAAVQGIANDVGSRERPYGRNCGKDIPADSVDCDGNVRYRSFFSGHTTLSFVSAGLLCTNHLMLGLLGPEGDRATCVGGVLVATMSSVFRVMSDMHYATDVAVGALVGTAAGITVPLLHYKGPGSSSSSTTKTTGIVNDVRLSPVGQGLGVVGTF